MLFAILLTFGVVMGMLALSVDIGTITLERRQLQNGADAAALALAQTCAKQTSACDPASTVTELEALASGNAGDRLAQLDRSRGLDGQCGRPTATFKPPNLPECPSGQRDTLPADPVSDQSVNRNLGECPPLPTWLRNPAIPYVETYSRTLSTQPNPTVLPRFFSQALAGSTETSVTACSRVAWGAVGESRVTLPVVVGLCNWNAATNNGTSLVQSPPYSPPPNAGNAAPSLTMTDGQVQAPSAFATQVFAKLNPSDNVTKFPCNPDLENPPGHYGPGGFGWVQTCDEMPHAPTACGEKTTACDAAFLATGDLPGKPGASMPSSCRDVILSKYLGQEVDLPVVTAVTGQGRNLRYTVAGIASFFLAGYSDGNGAASKSGNAYRDDVLSYTVKTCRGYKSQCLWGWFTSPVRAVGSISAGTPARGPVVVNQAG